MRSFTLRTRYVLNTHCCCHSEISISTWSLLCWEKSIYYYQELLVLLSVASWKGANVSDVKCDCQLEFGISEITGQSIYTFLGLSRADFFATDYTIEGQQRCFFFAEFLFCLGQTITDCNRPALAQDYHGYQSTKVSQNAKLFCTLGLHHGW